jgi:hypothetical protein
MATKLQKVEQRTKGRAKKNHFPFAFSALIRIFAGG